MSRVPECQERAVACGGLSHIGAAAGRAHARRSLSIGTARFELATPRSQSGCATRLRYVPSSCQDSLGARGGGGFDLLVRDARERLGDDVAGRLAADVTSRRLRRLRRSP